MPSQDFDDKHEKGRTDDERRPQNRQRGHHLTEERSWKGGGDGNAKRP